MSYPVLSYLVSFMLSWQCPHPQSQPPEQEAHVLPLFLSLYIFLIAKNTMAINTSNTINVPIIPPPF